MRVSTDRISAADPGPGQVPGPVSIAAAGGFFVAGQTAPCEGHPVRRRVAGPDAPAVNVDPNGIFRSGQMYVSEIRVARPATPVPVALLHGGGLSGASFEVSLDDGEPWLMSLLRAGFTTLCCDRPGAGRAGWARFPEIFAAEPRFFPAKEIWELFRIGPAGSYVSPSRRTAFPGSRFPVAHFDRLLDQFIPAFNTEHHRAEAAYAELFRQRGPLIVISHSAAGPHAITAMARDPGNVAAQVLLEPDRMLGLAGIDVAAVAAVPHMFIWGDFIHEDPSGHWAELRQASLTYAEALRDAGGEVAWLDLPAEGITGNSHMIMFDDNAGDVLSTIITWLRT